jgi:hypothetical protein
MTSERHETPNVRTGGVAAALAGWLLFAFVAVAGLHAFYLARTHDARLAPQHTFPAPSLDVSDDGLRDPEIDKQQADLERYRWIDQAHGVFQIPIERAMALVAARDASAYDPVRARPAEAKP